MKHRETVCLFAVLFLFGWTNYCFAEEFITIKEHIKTTSLTTQELLKWNAGHLLTEESFIIEWPNNENPDNKNMITFLFYQDKKRFPQAKFNSESFQRWLNFLLAQKGTRWPEGNYILILTDKTETPNYIPKIAGGFTTFFLSKQGEERSVSVVFGMNIPSWTKTIDTMFLSHEAHIQSMVTTETCNALFGFVKTNREESLKIDQFCMSLGLANKCLAANQKYQEYQESARKALVVGGKKPTILDKIAYRRLGSIFENGPIFKFQIK